MIGFKDVIKGCIKNRNESKELLYKAFYGYLMAVVLRYVNNRAEAEEIVNDTFLKSFNALHKFTIQAENELAIAVFKAWIAKIASRTAIDFLRSRKLFVPLDEVIANEEPITSINVLNQLNAKDILKLLDDLPDIQRVIFNLYEIEGYSHQEISKLLEIPESSCRVYLTRAKEKLRKLYAKTLISTYETNRKSF